MASNTAYAVQVDVIESGQVTSVEEGALYIKDSELKAVIGGSEVSVYPAASTTTTTTVNISSAQILAMGSTPIELLPAAGVGKYYDIEKIILEYTHVTTAYTLADDYLYTVIPLSAVSNQLITSGSSGYAVMSPINNGASNLETYTFTYPVVNSLNTAMTLTTWASTDPTLGDGTLRAIITYTTRTFGA